MGPSVTPNSNNATRFTPRTTNTGSSSTGNNGSSSGTSRSTGGSNKSGNTGGTSSNPQRDTTLPGSGGGRSFTPEGEGSNPLEPKPGTSNPNSPDSRNPESNPNNPNSPNNPNNPNNSNNANKRPTPGEGLGGQNNNRQTNGQGNKPSPFIFGNPEAQRQEKVEKYGLNPEATEREIFEHENLLATAREQFGLDLAPNTPQFEIFNQIDTAERMREAVRLGLNLNYAPTRMELDTFRARKEREEVFGGGGTGLSFIS